MVTAITAGSRLPTFFSSQPSAFSSARATRSSGQSPIQPHRTWIDLSSYCPTRRKWRGLGPLPSQSATELARNLCVARVLSDRSHPHSDAGFRNLYRRACDNVTGPEQLDGSYLREKAAEEGILIEPVKRYFSNANYPENCFRMGITSIPNDRIQEGVKKLAQLIYQLTADYEENLINAKGRLLDDAALKKLLPGIILETQMVYGVPCTIELCVDGTMTGYIEDKDHEEDIGRWWIEDGIYYRQWNLWVYGEVKGYYVILDNDIMKWFDQNNRFVRELVIKNHE